jgi:hypothetical protein
MQSMSPQRFEGVLGPENRPVIEVPAGIVEALGAGKRPPVRATVNGYTFRTTVAVYGGKFYVELPSDFARALDADPRAKAAFEALSFTHRKEHVQSIVQSKKEETRRRRIDKALQTLRSGPKAR